MTRCACPSPDARRCIRLRYERRPVRSVLDLDADIACEAVSCDCSCHSNDDRDLDDEEDT